MILPGATLGVLGGGQLGRFFVLAALEMGYRVVVLDPDPDSPAGRIAHLHLCAAFDDAVALARMAGECAAVTTEFENVPAATMEWLAAHTGVAPSPHCVAVAQHRAAEKTWLNDNGFPSVPFAVVSCEADLAAAAEVAGFPALLKRSRFGYDGKGQLRVASLRELDHAFDALQREPCVLEALLELQVEVSVVLARGGDGQCVPFPVAENSHTAGILDVCVVPARVSEEIAQAATRMAAAIAERLGYVGVLGVEFFVAGGRLLVNEIAPRPHNSGHYTLDACSRSQFEQQLRALCGLPLGDADLRTPAAMVNILGDAWKNGEPDWERLLSDPRVRLRLYGKAEPRPGRKMGHFTVLAAERDSALRVAEELRAALPAR